MNQKTWDRFAPIYNLALRSEKHLFETMYTRIAQVVEGKDVLEIACGPGQLAKHIAPSANEVVATDYSSGMIHEAQKGMTPANLSFMVANAMNLPFEDDAFDVVVIANALHIIPAPERVLAEIDRVLKDGGLLVAPNFVAHEEKRGARLWTRILRTAGITFEQQWTAADYMTFLTDNGWEIQQFTVMHARIPLLYCECTSSSSSVRIS
ncbi:class I SAM-dependent methyltransferase [Atopobium sp. oral taxon 810]|uniref:class I SAM-dependent methyltransferase n=1 Tax=Atopobium sp. oral taxon 810 TaxID=712158 RepID=UPI000419906E|nr:class I SAM-dependent methyltransferase [Atopobium sp. oral taxon 810]